jgi:uncharacterized RDD family membrane protein YckC
MEELNPYAPPLADPVPALMDDAELPPASRLSRLGAAIIDWLIITAILFVIQAVTGTLQKTVNTHGGGYFVSFHMAQTWFWTLIWFAVWALVNWMFLLQGQTIGKRLLKLKMLRQDGSPVAMVRLLVHRSLVFTGLGMIPYIGWFIVLVDILLIFRPDRNTLHDDLADTKVVRLPR